MTLVGIVLSTVFALQFGVEGLYKNHKLLFDILQGSCKLIKLVFDIAMVQAFQARNLGSLKI